MKKGVKRVMILIITSFFIGTVFTTFHSETTVKATFFYGDIVDQYQMMDSYHAAIIEAGYPSWQSFKPSMSPLTKVELFVNYHSNTDPDAPLNISIKKGWTGDVLTSCEVAAEDMKVKASWIEFDFDDISVKTEEEYYIIVSTSSSAYEWRFNTDDLYPRGGGSRGGDFLFKTYSYGNVIAPVTPTINGSVSGSTSQSYPYQITSSDHYGRVLYYYIDWGDGSVEGDGWIGPYASGETIEFNHSWYKSGSYEINITARTIEYVESKTGTLTVSMPKNKTMEYPIISWLSEKLVQRFPFFEKILNQ
ncbi:MAG: hypothetical protein MUO82_08560, partial [Candidatus Thermoplasmatota archaeon]|nr:hypothetical protein [Candidatus Thermoplasmatota archaeon]